MQAGVKQGVEPVFVPEVAAVAATGPGEADVPANAVDTAETGTARADALAAVEKVDEAWKVRSGRIESMAQHLEETVAVAITSLKTAAGAMNEAVEAVAVTSEERPGGSRHERGPITRRCSMPSRRRATSATSWPVLSPPSEHWRRERTR